MAFNCNCTMQAVAVLTVIITLVVLNFKYKLSYWSKRGVASLPHRIPFGHIADQVFQKRSLGEIIQECYLKMKQAGMKYAGFYSFTAPSLVIIEPELIRTILTKEFHNFHDRSVFTNEKVDPLTGHLFLLKGEKWRFLRTKLTPTFTSGKMKMMFQTLIMAGEQLDKTIQKQVDTAEPIEVKDILARFTTDVIGSCAFGLDCNSLQDPNAEFRRYGKMIFDLSVWDSLRRTIIFSIPKVNVFLKLRIINENIHNFFMKAVHDIIAYRENNKIERKDFMDLLIKLKNNESIDDEETYENVNDNKTNSEPGLTFNQIAAQCFVFFIAGFETSSSTMTFCLYELSVNTDIQTKARKEIVHVLQKYNGNITYDAIMEMHYLDKIFKETLRKHPIVPFLNRNCVKEFKVPGTDFVIEEGTNIFIPVLGIHRDPEYYPDPMKFDPERFSEEETVRRHNYTYLPFGEGPRNCIGMRFGLMQAKVGLAILIKNYSFTLHTKLKEPLQINPKGFVLSTKETIWLDAKRV